MKVRATKTFRHLSTHHSEGDVLSLVPIQALPLLQDGSVEPVIELEPFRPSLDIKGLTLWDAYLIHVHGFPPLEPLLDEADLDLQPYCLYVRQCAALPEWLGFPAARSGRSVRPRRNFATDWQDWGDGVRVTVSAQDPWVKSGFSLEERYQNALRDYMQRAAIHFFLQRLADGELDAIGVGEGDLKTLKETKIPAGWWRRDIELDLHRNEILELMGPSPEQRVRRFSAVRVQNPTASKRRKGRGRRSQSKRLVKAFHELWENGSLTKEDLKNKKGVWTKVLEHLGYSENTPGCSYNTFVEHVGLQINQVLQSRDSEN